MEFRTDAKDSGLSRKVFESRQWDTDGGARGFGVGIIISKRCSGP